MGWMRTSTTPPDAADSASSSSQPTGEPQREAAAMPVGGGEMGALMRSIDWAQTPVGSQETWPQSLRTALSILLESRFPMYIAWGPQFVQFYNDGYRPILGSTKHPGAMGRSASSTFAESWHIIGPMFEGVRQGKAVGSEDWMLPLDRNGYLEECYFTFSYSPIRDESGGVGGVHVTVTETTGRVLGERRLRTLRDLAARAGPARREHDAWQEAARVLQGNALDVPFALLYRMTDADQRPELVAAAGWGTDSAAAVSLLGAPQANLLWPFADAAAALTPQFVPDVRARFEEPPKGPWPEAPRSAWVLPVSRLGSARLHGFLVAGLSARRAPDDDYRKFLEWVADHIATAISNASADEEEKKRVEARAELDRAKTVDTLRFLEESRRATRLREDMLAVVSHDLRSPLTAIRTSAELLQRIPLDGEPLARVRKKADAIRRSADQMNRLIDDLLDLASIDAGTLSIQPHPQRVEELVHDAREVFEPQAAEKGVQLAFEVEPGLILTCDKERILQALGNLLTNAIKFTPPEGSILLQAKTEEGTGHIRFSVADTGPGIPPAAQPHIFDRYWHEAQHKREGHGLGLSIAKGIVESHGGQIRLERTSGEGSTLSFSLPSGPQEAGAVLPAHRRIFPPPGAGESFIQGGGEMGALMRSFDWSKNSLGPLEAWPQSLRTSVSTMLRSPYPIILFWGPELRMLYNDPFRPILGAKHPQTLGARGHEALAEEWALLGPLMKRVHETGDPLFIENGNVNFARRPGGLREEAYFTWSYNPTIGERGEIAGLFAIASETTRQVVGDRRLGILRELSIRAALDKKVEGVFRSLDEVLAQAGNDLPFSLLYAVEAGKARLVSCAGLARGAPAAPLGLSLGDAHPWPLAAVASQKQEVLVENLHLKLGHLPGGPWPEPATRALVLPVPMGADTAATGVLVAGLSPLVALDDEYRGFLQLLARQLAASLSSARAYEQEKQRAEALALLDQAKTAFFSNVSHEFRTPLTLILGPIEDALSKPEKSLEGEKLSLVRRSALRLYKMVNTLLDFSRIEAGRAEAHYVPVDLSAVTRNLASAFQSAVESAGLRLVVECPPLPEPLYVDPEMWEKVVLNLLSNAVKYTYEGEIRLGLRWQESHVVLTVEDTGVGIPEEELPRVFERFYRVRVTQGRSHEGTGIGLALVQDLVKLHGGSISVESKLGEGTAFTLRLPRGSAHLPPERIERTPRLDSFSAGIAPFVEEAQRWSSDATGAGMPSAGASDEPGLEVPEELARARILLVDDNADLRTYVAGLLGRVFRHVETATNGNDALERVRAQPPDLILSDVMMPGLDGFGLVRALRAGEDTRAIPIILLSARAGDESTVEGLQSGADDYLVKPFSARELMVRVRTQLDMARVRREVVRNELEKKVLRESVQVRDEFLGLVSHELRTPVAALSLNFQSLVRSLGSEDQAEAIGVKAQTTQKQVHRLTRLVERLLDVSEVFTGRLKITPQEVDLSAVASAVVEQARNKAAHAGCVLTVNAPSPVIGHCDRARLNQLLEGLIDNALKFGAGSPVEVAVRRDSDHAFLTVVDHGAGIRPEDEERIFGRFERAVSENHYGGFGLGLWLARYIAEAHAGSIRLMPTEGGGATFTVALPLNGTLG
ncbi:Signal transduction histidine kinase [Stigmatella aurantiaca]|uniref:histidine kinase n=2 Tax=Stigmatella aurantiaca TaxID=41 RepID=A0A1H8FAE8_STIAU|nr:Signal transduction histidine kinase [Stigmatella aurantiaca]